MTGRAARTPKAFIKMLQGTIDSIGSLEKEAQAAVEKRDNDAYVTYMYQKAKILTGVYDQADSFLDAMDDNDAVNYAERSLLAFAKSAKHALDLDSVFYMSALLYPETHKAGDPNTLEVFRDEMKKRLGL